MSAERKAIRQAVAALLVGKTAANARVFATRAFPLWDQDELPAILVYTETEDSSVFDAAPKRYKRTVRVAIQCVVRADAALDDALDDMAEAVENQIALDDTLGGLASDCRVTQIEMTVLGEGEQSVGACRIMVDVDYFKLAPVEQPEPVVSALTRADVNMDLAPADGRIDSTQRINLPQT